MKPPQFDYFRPASVAEAVALLARHGADAKLLAGGQSLVPLLNFRMVRPAAIIDIDRLGELDFIAEEGDGLRIGALTRHRTLGASAPARQRFPMLADAIAHVAHPAIRNRGTIGGSLAHADPAAELPMLALLLDAEIATRSAAGERRRKAAGFFRGPLTTALGADEIVCEIVLPALPQGTGSSFAEIAERAGDFAIAAAAAALTVADGAVAAARLALTGVGETPLRLHAVEAGLVGTALSPEIARSAAQQARDSVDPTSDLRASADYRRHLVAVLTERVLTAAWADAVKEAA